MMQETFNTRDPLAELDQQWEQERINYVGVHNADRRIKFGSLSLIGSIMIFFGLASIAFLREALDSGDIRAYILTIAMVGVSLTMGFGVYFTARLTLAERRYLKQRATLAQTLQRSPQPIQVTPLHRISSPSNPQSARWTAAETRIYALQELHYAEPKRDKAYAAAIQKIIVDAPKAEQTYLTELAQLEQRWVVERLRYRNIQPYYQHYQYRQLDNED